MHIDTSGWKAWWTCPEKYRLRYQQNLERKRLPGALEFGTRVHALLEARLKGVPPPPVPPPEEFPEGLESEAQVLLAAYEAAYPQEPWQVVAVERTFQVILPEPSKHALLGKFDAIVRYTEGPFEGMLAVLEHKTESRNSATNDPQAWIARMQKSLYVWAAEALYEERVAHIILDVLTRASEKGQCPPTFRRDHLETDTKQICQALADLDYVADRVEALEESAQADTPWPRNTESCMHWRAKCDYYALCHLGHTPENLSLFQEAKPYLSL